MMYDDMKERTEIAQDVLADYVIVPVYKEFGPTKSDVFYRLANTDIIDKCGFNMFMNICTFLCEGRHSIIHCEDYMVVTDIAHEKALSYISSNHEFSAAYKFYKSVSYNHDADKQFSEMLLFSKNMLDNSIQVITAEAAIRAIHYINVFRKSEENMFIYNLDLLHDIIRAPIHMSAKFVNHVDKYVPHDTPVGRRVYDSRAYSNNSNDFTITSTEDFYKNMTLYYDFLSAIISGDNEKAYDMLPEEDKNMVYDRR